MLINPYICAEIQRVSMQYKLCVCVHKGCVSEMGMSV